MQPINADNYIPLRDSLLQNRYISCSEGQWRVDSCLLRFVRWIFRTDSDRLLNIVNVFNKTLEDMESVPFHNSADEKITADHVISLSEAIENYTKSNPKTAHALNRMKLKIISLKYRMNINTGAKEVHDLNVLKEGLKSAVSRWKEQDPLFSDKALSPHDFRKIDQFIKYPEFAQFLIEHPEQAAQQFKIAIRDNVDVKALVEFNHHVTDFLYKSHLTGRIGALARKQLRVSDRNSTKNLELRFRNHGWVNILDRNHVHTFSNGRQVALRAIFDSYRSLNHQPTSGEFEIFYDGLDLWNGHEWGAKKEGAEGYETLDVSQPRYWEKLPVYDIATKEQIQRKYHINIKDAASSIQVLESTRLTLGISLEGHGYTIFYIPTGDGVTYKVFPFGLYANTFPTNSCQNASFIGDTVPGKIVFPDPNYAYPRQKASLAIEISPRQLEMQMRRIAATRLDGGWFMWTWENCCHYAKNLLLKVIDEKSELHSIVKKRTFKVPFLQARADNWFINAIQTGYKACQFPFVKPAYEEMVFALLGTWRTLPVKETVFEDGHEFILLASKSSYQSKFCKSITNNLPSVFHSHVERGEIPGAVLSYGHGRNQ